ncbi:MAG: CAP domain-containing protein [Bacteroidales bacterium]
MNPFLKNQVIGLFLLLTFFSSNFSSAQDSIPPDFCISADEYRLFNLVNDYRKAMNLPKIQLSKSLSFVAKNHAIDLYTNKADTNTCNFHSWSDKGNWKACCFEKEIKDKSCMLKKPLELTNYPDVAYEIVYWENKQANADKAFDQWRETSASRALITNFKEWEDYNWVSMGVDI